MKGLTCRFRVVNGRIPLTEGVDKSRDSIWFYCIFDKFRIYVSDFGANFVSLVQKPVASLLMNKTLILGNLKKGIQKYVPNVEVRNVDIGYVSDKNRKELGMLIEYNSVQDDKSVIQDVTFV